MGHARRCESTKKLSSSLFCTQYAGKFRYELLNIEKDIAIGSGSFGTVFRAEYDDHFPCAVKLLNHHAQQLVTGFNTTSHIQHESLQRFRKECKFLQSLKHDNIVGHFHTHIEESSNLPILIMELMDCSLMMYLRENLGRELTLKRQTSLYLDIAEGLDFLHSKQIIHRDLCDVNVLLSRKSVIPKAKIADFGMSRLFMNGDDLSTTLTRLGNRDVYFPPEARDGHYSYPLDVYSFGVIAVQIVRVKIHLKNEELTQLRNEIPESHKLKNVIEKCLRKDHEERPVAAKLVHLISNDGRYNLLLFLFIVITFNVIFPQMTLAA